MKMSISALIPLVLVVMPGLTHAADTPRRMMSLDGIWQIAEGGMDQPPASFGAQRDMEHKGTGPLSLYRFLPQKQIPSRRPTP